MVGRVSIISSFYSWSPEILVTWTSHTGSWYPWYLGSQPAASSEVYKKMFNLHWGAGQSPSLMNPLYDPYMVVWWILLVVKLVVMVQKASSSGSVGPDRWSYRGFGEPERAIRLTPPFDTHGNFKSREQSISQPRVLVSSPIASPFDRFSSLLLWSFSTSC